MEPVMLTDKEKRMISKLLWNEFFETKEHIANGWAMDRCIEIMALLDKIDDAEENS